MAQNCKTGLLNLTVVYFWLSAMAAVYLAAESWRVNFLDTPVAAVLTALAALFICTAIVGIDTISRGPSRCFLLSALYATLLVAACKGSYFAGFNPMLVMKGIFSAVFGLLLYLMLRRNAGHQSLSSSSESLIRLSAMILPVPIIAYASFSLFVMGNGEVGPAVTHYEPTSFYIGARKTFVACDTFLFGTGRLKRHVGWFRRLSQFCESNHDYGCMEASLKDIIAMDGIIGDCSECSDSDVLACLYDRQGRHAEADALYAKINSDLICRIKPPGSQDHTVLSLPYALKLLSEVPENQALEAFAILGKDNWVPVYLAHKERLCWDEGREFVFVDLRPLVYDFREPSDYAWPCGNAPQDAPTAFFCGSDMRALLSRMDRPKVPPELQKYEKWMADKAALSSVRDSLPGKSSNVRKSCQLWPPLKSLFANGRYPTSIKELIPVQILIVPVNDCNKLLQLAAR